jgi:hypothetical protein
LSIQSLLLLDSSVDPGPSVRQDKGAQLLGHTKKPPRPGRRWRLKPAPDAVRRGFWRGGNPLQLAWGGKLGLDLALGTYDKAEEMVSGAARIYKAFNGARPLESKSGSQANTSILVFGNNNTVIADSGTVRLYSDDRVRSALTRAAGPLLHDGVDHLEVRRDTQVIERLERPDIGLSPAAELTLGLEEEPKAPTRDIWGRVVKPNFDGGRRTFHDGSAKFGADVEDQGFQAWG